MIQNYPRTLVKNTQTNQIAANGLCLMIEQGGFYVPYSPATQAGLSIIFDSAGNILEALEDINGIKYPFLQVATKKNSIIYEWILTGASDLSINKNCFICSDSLAPNGVFTLPIPQIPTSTGGVIPQMIIIRRIALFSTQNGLTAHSIFPVLFNEIPSGLYTNLLNQSNSELSKIDFIGQNNSNPRDVGTGANPLNIFELSNLNIQINDRTGNGLQNLYCAFGINSNHTVTLGTTFKILIDFDYA